MIKISSINDQIKFIERVALRMYISLKVFGKQVNNILIMENIIINCNL